MMTPQQAEAYITGKAKDAERRLLAMGEKITTLTTGPEAGSVECLKAMSNVIFDGHTAMVELETILTAGGIILGMEFFEKYQSCNASSAAAAGQPTGGNSGVGVVSARETSQPTPTRESTSSQ